MIRAVLIDIDDTLFSFDVYVREALKEGLPKFGIAEYREEMEAVFHRVNTGLWRSMERGEINYEQLYGRRFNDFFEALGVNGDGPAFEAYFRGKLRESASPMEGARELVEYLAGKYILCAASNGPFDQQENRLRVGGLLPHFSHLFISEDLGVSKPDPRFFETAMARLRAGGQDITPQECVMIGDSLTSDMAGGIAAGMKTIYYDHRRTGKTDGKTVDHIVTHLRDIFEIL